MPLNIPSSDRNRPSSAPTTQSTSSVHPNAPANALGRFIAVLPPTNQTLAQRLRADLREQNPSPQRFLEREQLGERQFNISRQRSTPSPATSTVSSSDDEQRNRLSPDSDRPSSDSELPENTNAKRSP